MKDYNFMISDDGLHKTRFCTKRGLTKTFLIKRGVGAKGRLERFRILTGEGGRQKEGGDFFKGGFIRWCPLWFLPQDRMSGEAGRASVICKTTSNGP